MMKKQVTRQEEKIAHDWQTRLEPNSSPTLTIEVFVWTTLCIWDWIELSWHLDHDVKIFNKYLLWFISFKKKKHLEREREKKKESDVVASRNDFVNMLEKEI